MPTSADDLEQADDTHDPLSFEEYSASAKLRLSRLRDTANHTPTNRTRIGKGNVSQVPSFETTNHATAALSRHEYPQTAAADQFHNDATDTEEELVERPRKKQRTFLLEKPIWMQPGLSR